jgi:hypothetical protein
LRGPGAAVPHRAGHTLCVYAGPVDAPVRRLCEQRGARDVRDAIQILCVQVLTIRQKRRPPLQPGGHHGCDVHGVVVVWVQLPPRHRQGPHADRVDEHLFRPVRRRVGGADAGHTRARPGYHQHRRDGGAAGHVVGGGGVRRQGGVPASEGGGCALGRGRGRCGGGRVMGVVRGEMKRRHGGGHFSMTLV